MRTLAAIMRQADAPAVARIQAITVLLDRGWGRSPQVHDTDGGPIHVVIRQLVDVVPQDKDEPLVLEHDALKK